MEELKRFSLVLVVTGIATIYIASALLQPEKLDIASIDEGDVGEYVRVPATVHTLDKHSDTWFMDLRGENDTISAVYFGDDLTVEEGKNYTVEGRVQLYQGNLDIVVRRIIDG